MTPVGDGRRRVGAVLGVVVMLLVLRWALAAPLAVPLQVDELAYLGNARFLATGAGLVATEGRAPFKIGYPLLLTPAARLWDGRPEPLFRAAQLVNSALAAALVPLGLWLATRLRPDLGFGDRLAAAACAALYPAVSLYATTAMAFNLLATGFLGFLCLAWWATSDPTRWPRWLAWGAWCGGLYAVHERALAWLAVAAAVAGVAAWRHRGWRPLALLPAVVAGASVERLAPLPGGSYDTGGTAVATVLAALHHGRDLLATACGQPWYLWLATGGLLVTGGWVALTRGHERDPKLHAAPLFWWTVVGTTASTVAMSVLHMAHRPDARFTHWIYGRYTESLAAGLVLLVLVVMAVAPSPRRSRLLLQGAAVSVATGLLLTVPLRLLWTTRIGRPFGFNASATCLYDALAGWGLLRAAAVGAVLTVALALGFWRSWRTGVAATTLLFLAATAAALPGYWLPKSRDRIRAREIARVLAAIDPPGRHLAYERRDWPSFEFYHDSFLLPDWTIELWGPRLDPVPPAPLVVTSRRDLGAVVPGARLVALERLPLHTPPFIQALWVVPGALADRLAARGWLLPADFPCPLDDAALAASLEVSRQDAGGPVRGGDTLPLRIDLEHRGTTPWPDRFGWRRRVDTVVIALRWRAADGRSWPAAIVELPRTLYPGERVQLAARPAAAGPEGEPLAPGHYAVDVSLAQRSSDLSPRDGPDRTTLPVEVVAR